MIHAILIVLGIWWAWNWLTRKRAPSMKLVQRNPELHEQIVAWHKQQHDTFAQRHTADFRDTLARMITVEEPYQAKLARRKLQRTLAACNALAMYRPTTPKNLDTLTKEYL